MIYFLFAFDGFIMVLSFVFHFQQNHARDFFYILSAVANVCFIGLPIKGKITSDHHFIF